MRRTRSAHPKYVQRHYRPHKKQGRKSIRMYGGVASVIDSTVNDIQDDLVDEFQDELKDITKNVKKMETSTETMKKFHESLETEENHLVDIELPTESDKSITTLSNELKSSLNNIHKINDKIDEGDKNVRNSLKGVYESIVKISQKQNSIKMKKQLQDSAEDLNNGFMELYEYNPQAAITSCETLSKQVISSMEKKEDLLKKMIEIGKKINFNAEKLAKVNKQIQSIKIQKKKFLLHVKKIIKMLKKNPKGTLPSQSGGARGDAWNTIKKVFYFFVIVYVSEVILFNLLQFDNLKNIIHYIYQTLVLPTSYGKMVGFWGSWSVWDSYVAYISGVLLGFFIWFLNIERDVSELEED